MRRLGTLVRKRVADLRSEESGISMVFVALSLVVLVGMVAFAVDTAALYQERRELQNGADAATIGIAENCIRNTHPCTVAAATPVAESFADANAGDLESAVDSVIIDTTDRQIEVFTSTETSTGGSIFRPFFARVIGFNGTTVHADAAAEYGYLSGGIATLPLIISACEWEREANLGQPYDPADPAAGGLHPAGGPYDPAGISLLKFHSGNPVADECAAVAGQDTDGDGKLSGGFGWLDDTDTDCEVELDNEQWVDEDPGASPTTGCSAATLKNLILNQIVVIPYFYDDNDLNGANGQYKVHNFATIYVTGYNFGGQFKEPGSGPCSGSVRCLEGYFVDATIDEGDTDGDYGVVVVKFIR